MVSVIQILIVILNVAFNGDAKCDNESVNGMLIIFEMYWINAELFILVFLGNGGSEMGTIFFYFFTAGAETTLAYLIGSSFSSLKNWSNRGVKYDLKKV